VLEIQPPCAEGMDWPDNCERSEQSVGEMSGQTNTKFRREKNIICRKSLSSLSRFSQELGLRKKN
jgi:hypothetical protein